MADRKAELEKKKAKLEQMKAARRAMQQTDAAQSNGLVSAPQKNAVGADEILRDLGIPLPTNSADAPVNQPRADIESDGSITNQECNSTLKKNSSLSISKVTQTTLPPKDLVQYNKETQTPKENTEKEYEDGDSSEPGTEGHKIAPSTPQRSPAIQEEAPPVEEKPVIQELSEEQRKTIMMSEEFQVFFNKASNIVERALGEYIDIFTDYSGQESDENTRGLSEGEQLKVNRNFFSERWSKNRIVTSLDWSTQFPELLLASHNNDEGQPQEPDGVVLVWNVKYKKTTPEYVFHYQSPVTSACFAKFHPNLIIGGTYSGHIVLWDNRSNKRTPVQRTPISAAVHTHPVYCLEVVGTQNAHNLASVSTDGKMCFWNLDMLSQPQESMELQQKQSKSTAALCFSFPVGDSNNFVIGSEEGIVYSACRHGNKAGILDLYESHQGPVTGIDCHSVQGGVDFSSYFISSSFDWTVKLWNIRESSPLHSFEDNSEYIYDAKWSTVHPALFSTVDGSGRLDLWNLNIDTEVPAASTIIENGAAANKCRWHQAGLNIAVGDDEGSVHIYDVAESLAIPKSDEWTKFSHTLQDLKQEQADQNDDQKSLLAQQAF